MRLIDADAAIDALDKTCDRVCEYPKKQRAVMCRSCPLAHAFDVIEELPTAQQETPCHLGSPCEYQNQDAKMPAAQSERLTDDDFETIRIHLNAYKEKLCNQQRWGEAEEYQRIIDRFMAFASAHLPTAERKGHWNAYYHDKDDITYSCNQCGYGAPFQILGGKISQKKWSYCPNCGARMEHE